VLRVLALATALAAISAVAFGATGSELRPEFARATCSSGPFPIDALRSPTGAQRADHPAAKVLRELIRNPRLNEEIEGRVPKKRWRQLLLTDRAAIFGSGDAERITTLSVKRTRRSGWDYRNLDGHCQPVVVREGLSATEWRLDPERPEPTPASTTVHILIDEAYCNSGAPPEPERILEPTVRYAPGTVTVTYFLDFPDRFETCPGSPPAAWQLSLSEPLGDRALRDGGTVVPKRRFPELRY
jgi:hypothetical protein